MARFMTVFDVDLQKPTSPRPLRQMIGEGDSSGMIIGVRVYDDGTPVALGGSCVGKIVRADGATVQLSGTIDGNMASVVLDQMSCAVEGPVQVAVCWVASTSITTLLLGYGAVVHTQTGNAIQPSEPIPDLTQLLAEIEAMRTATAAANAAAANALSNFAGLFSADMPYPAGTYVAYTDGKIYVLPNGHTADTAWGNTAKLPITACGEIDAIKAVLNNFGSTVFPTAPYVYSRVGVTFTSRGNTVHASGTSAASGVCFVNLYELYLPTQGIKGGDTIYIDWASDDKTKLFPQLYLYKEGSSAAYATYSSDEIPAVIQLDPACNTLVVRARVPNSTAVNHSITLSIQKFPAAKWILKGNDIPLGDTGDTIDLNEVLETGFYMMHDAVTYINAPQNPAIGTGFLQSVYTGSWRFQLLYTFSGFALYKRRGNKAGTSWEAWQKLSGGGNTYNITNEYTFPEYAQTVTLNASPTITTDTNYFLAPTGDNTDRTADILAMLTANGVCRLGSGEYYVNGLQMPNGSSIIGCGIETRIIMGGTADGFAIKLGSRCHLSGFSLQGASSAPTHTATSGGRHGILWQGDYTEHRTAPYIGMIDTLWIYNFSGDGIRCYDTGYGTSNGLLVTNVHIFNCWAGIDIAYWSEFHKLTNVRCGSCRIGCINNGGNNIFVNCDFSSNEEIAMLMDNSQGQSPNNTHGSAIGCVFNHTASGGTSNSGIGIKILNCENGFVFDGCQIFFSRIHLENSNGITVTACNFGYDNCDIEISGGGCVLFMGNQHQQRPTITITNNDKVHFANCYDRTTGALIE